MTAGWVNISKPGKSELIVSIPELLSSYKVILCLSTSPPVGQSKGKHKPEITGSDETSGDIVGALNEAMPETRWPLEYLNDLN